MGVAAAPPPPPSAALVTLACGVRPAALGILSAEPLWPGSRTFLVRLPGGATPDAVRRLRARRGVVAVEPDRVRRRVAPAATAPGQGDPLRRLQPHLVQIRWTPPARRAVRPLVAVLDTGVDPRTPDLRGRLDLARARSFAPGTGGALVDREGHGTHVAGIIAAVSDNGVGVSGVAAARILPVKIADQAGNATTSSLVRGIRYAIARRARIVNVSFGGDGRSALEQAAIDDAVRAGALVVAAAGNSGRLGSPREYPGAYRHVLAVGAVDGSGRPLPTSTRGPQVALAAPGLEVLSTAPSRSGGAPGYAVRSGTSMAAAVVSGVAARIWAARPRLRASQVAALLTGSARDVGAPGWDVETGAGVVDLAAALGRPAPPADTAEPNDEPSQAARTRPLLPGGGTAAARVVGRLSPWSDPRDGYRVALAAGDALEVELQEPAGADLDLVLWRPGARRFTPDPGAVRALVAGSAVGPARGPAISLVAPATGVYTLEVRAVRGGGVYRLAARRTTPAAG
jgi:hypothetical protein